MTTAMQVDGIAPLDASRTHRLVESFLAGRNPRTLRAYRQDLDDFHRYIGAATLSDAVTSIIGHGHGQANETALLYKAALCDKGLAPATINRRLASLRSLTKFARTLGLIPWSLEVAGVQSQGYRDTRGCGVEGVRAMLGALADRSDAKAARDRAIIRLLYDLALRRGEVSTLDVEHLDLERRTVSVLGKGRHERENLTIPETTMTVLRDWLAVRGSESGPLFLNLDLAKHGGRLSGTSIYRIVRDLGRKVGFVVRPHALRHSAITHALDVMSGNIRAVVRYSRHRDIRTVEKYDDARTDMGGKIATLVSQSA